MSHPQTRYPHKDRVRGGVRDKVKDERSLGSEVSPGASNDSEDGTFFHGLLLHESHRCTPDFENESDGEEPSAHGTPRSRVAQSLITNVPEFQVEPIFAGLDRTGARARVRFRSRVRISAGIGQRRRGTLSDGISSDASSAVSGSPSSSISAPLRTHYTERDGWTPLGSRVNPLSSSQAVTQLPFARPGDKHAGGGKSKNGGANHGNADGKIKGEQARCTRSPWAFVDDGVDEHTCLVTSATTYSYVSDRYAHDWYHDDAEQERRWREHLVDEAFGKWPARLLNRHWWWWRLKPVLCYVCDDPDDEE